MYNKQANIKLDTSSHISNHLNTGVEFYNTDIGTAELVFYVTRNNKPLLVSADNVDCYLILKSDDDYIVDSPTIKDAMNGVLSYVVPADLLGVANGKSVQGQLYLAVKGKEDVVTEVDFSFAVKDALINTIPAVDKLHEIRTMQEFKQSITTAIQDIQDINNSIENSKAYLGELEAMYKTGLTKLQDKSDEAEQSLTTLATNKQTDLENTGKGELDKINEASQTAQDNINALNNAVHVSGNQTISGVKNFIDTPTVNGNKVLDDSLQIGGRNYLLNTANSRTMTGDGTHPVTADRAYLFSDKDYVRGKQMMFSVDVTKTEGTTGKIMVMIGRTWQSVMIINVADIPVNTTKRLITPVTVRDEENRGDLYFQTPDKLLDGSVTLSHVMMAEGTKPTDWTPAPEDLATVAALSKVDQKANEIGTFRPIMAGNYGLRVTAGGFQKTTDGGATWTTANI